MQHLKGSCDKKREWKRETLENRERARDIFRTKRYTKTSEDGEIESAADVSGFDVPELLLTDNDILDHEAQEPFDFFGGGFDDP